MKQAFEPVNLKPNTLKRIAEINIILDEYEAQGYQLTVRQLFYQLLSKNIIANTKSEYERLARTVKSGRYCGMIDWDAIVDRGRGTLIQSAWSSPAEIAQTCVTSYHERLWENQSHYLEVIVEKQALEGVLEHICNKYDVPLTSNKGYTSTSLLYIMSKRFRKQIALGKVCTILYMGDHDPSGMDMVRDVEERIAVLTEADIQVKRIGLNHDQVQRYKPLPNGTKKTDSRAKEYIRTFGAVCWELDALPPSVLSELLEDAINAHRDPVRWQVATDRMEANRAKLATFAQAVNA